MASTADSPVNRLLHERYKALLRAAMGKPHVQDRGLSHLIDDLYRQGATVGSGSTADAAREELITGVKVKGADHVLKSKMYIRALEKWLDAHPTASPGDRAAAENVLADLRDALEGPS